ncbi:glycosyl hydrolase, family 13 [Hyphomonas neptunium ATCC 15444]|uniref:Glycosyl hydrolase, family 13 n=2 Tax=Hyphomonas TaxID=85 RepID=Q0C1F2_HYPNA|nr:MULTISPECIES: alpha-amylase family glycosyl hydrolase [Hyphomonas]ABI78166.1 glycosyl hydrolase, family 13 [Hyphomonas neptunium ATCC 15444]KCZ95146.1 glycosyl hydrolase family protein [Hyphomonas hirschiana VP5]
MSPETQPWWRGAVIYQIYPRSYQDSNSDGVGDLPGITRRLDHIASLGVSAIWISPFFKSPMKDFGYDVSDYCDVDPAFGTLADFDTLMERARSLGLKVIIDQVYAHTSDAHAWFAESRASRANPKADWFVWRDAKPDGTPPNNWQSVFGGPAWTWDARRGQYFMHNFLSSQPQLNVHNPEVQDALLSVAKFWLDRGVDGFRLDAINFAMFDPEFRDNPPWPAEGRTITRPFDLQHHIHNQSHPDIPVFMERVRALADTYGDIYTVAEVPGPDPLPEMRAFTSEGRLSSAYSFDFLYAKSLSPRRVKASQMNWAGPLSEGWAAWAFSNHDAPRCISRWCPPGGDLEAYAKMTNALLLCLRGNPILYQGEELGLTQAEIAFEDLQDPEAIANWPLTLGRDGARTPMPWINDNSYAGFSEVKPWLPVGAGHALRAAMAQYGQPFSVLEFTRLVISLRSSSDILKFGSVSFPETQGDLLAIERRLGEDRLLCLFNLGIKAVSVDVALPRFATTLLSSDGRLEGPENLPPFGVWIGTVGPHSD